MKIDRLKTNRITNPLGYDLKKVFFSWTVEESNGKKALWSRVEVSEDKKFEKIIYDSGEDSNADSIAFYPNMKLNPCTRYYWHVTVKSDDGETCISNLAWFETPLDSKGIKGKMISPDLPYDVCPYMRKSFTIDSKVVNARAYFTGLGIYELYINGKKASREFLVPGCDAYDKWLQYQTYDVTTLLHTGTNVVGAIIGNGWAKGRFGFDGKPGSYEKGTKGQPCDNFIKEYMLYGELSIKTTKGVTVVYTDKTWQSAPSPITFSGIYDGERYDSRLEIDSWCEPECQFGKWNKVKEYNDKIGTITPRMSLPVVIRKEFPVSLVDNKAGEIILDVGQEITGWIEFKCSQDKNKEIRLQYGEILQDGQFYRDNMRSALCEFRFISDGKTQIVRPYTTFYGFRYVKISGWVGEINTEDFKACAVSSDLEMTGEIKTGNNKVNRLFKNSVWSQIDNFVDVPTDCPQRDERMGWTGDAQVFCGTANFNMDCLQFYKKYGRDLYLDQKVYNGRVPVVTPIIAVNDKMLTTMGGACGWADAATVVPWTTYVYSGSVSILEEQYNSMKDWADWIFSADKSFKNDRLWHATYMHFGDWLALDGAKSGFDPEATIGGTDNTFLCSVYYYYSTLLVSKAAKVLDKKRDEIMYEKRAANILTAIRKEFFTPGGRCAAATQTGNAMSLFFGICKDKDREKVLGQLESLLKQNDMYIKTGFLGTPVLLRALSDNSDNESAYTLLLNEKMPSWLYEVNMGATTIWERWNSILPNGKISGTSMNSMNHYSYGAVMEWVYRNVCGINPDEEHPGFRRFSVKPMPDKRLKRAEATFKSPCGLIVSGWKYIGNNITYNIVVPFGAEADVQISEKGLKNKTINGNAVKAENGYITQLLCSGKYEIS
jgi:alpha-L-rhamnosidase